MAEGEELLKSKGFKVKTAEPKRKYHNVPTIVHGIRFDSKKEAEYYGLLHLTRHNGGIRAFFRQVPFDLPGGIKFKADFVVIGNDGTITIEEVKGFRTQTYKLKKKLVEDAVCRPFGIGFREIR